MTLATTKSSRSARPARCSSPATHTSPRGSRHGTRISARARSTSGNAPSSSIRWMITYLIRLPRLRRLGRHVSRLYRRGCPALFAPTSVCMKVRNSGKQMMKNATTVVRAQSLIGAHWAPTVKIAATDTSRLTSRSHRHRRQPERRQHRQRRRQRRRPRRRGSFRPHGIMRFRRRAPLGPSCRASSGAATRGPTPARAPQTAMLP